jgi:hypothetical protein
MAIDRSLLALLTLVLVGKPGLCDVILLEVTPVDDTDFVVQQELKEISFAFQEAKETFSRAKKECKIVTREIVQRGTSSDLFEVAKRLTTTSGRDDTLVGFSRTSFARIVAKAAESSKSILISSGASTDSLKSIYPRAYSIVSPWQSQWAVLNRKISSAECKSGVVGVFDDTNHLSRLYKEQFSQSKLANKRIALVPKISTSELKEPCIFFGIDFSTSEPYFRALVNTTYPKKVFGIGDWTIFADEVKALAKIGNGNIQVFGPTGLTMTKEILHSKFSSSFSKKFNRPLNPISVYTFDATILAQLKDCEKRKSVASLVDDLNKLSIRHYTGVGDGNNILSNMSIQGIFVSNDKN